MSDDLDAAMGRLELEAARRRAEPAFPIDEDVRLSSELDSVAPHRGPTTAVALAAVVASLPMPVVEQAEPVRKLAALRRRADRPGPGHGDPAGDLRRVALDLVDVCRSLDARLAALEARAPTAASAATVGPADGSARGGPAAGGSWEGGPPAAAAARGGAASGAWVPAVVELVGAAAASLSPGGGRVWWSGPAADEAVGELRRLGLDAYGTDPAGDAWATGVDGRRADPVEHLGAVPDGGLAAVILAGPLPGADEGRLARLVDALGRTTATVAVCSPTPQWWREVVGPEAADVGGDRTLGADTWMAALGRSGWDCTVVSGREGRTYLLTARRATDRPAP